MSASGSILSEFERETSSTRKVPERLPEDWLDRQPYPKSHTIGRNANHLAAVTDDKIGQPRSLLNAGETIMTTPRAAVTRSFVLNRIIHHRAVFCVDDRLTDVPVTGTYGPSGAE